VECACVPFWPSPLLCGFCPSTGRPFGLRGAPHSSQYCEPSRFSVLHLSQVIIDSRSRWPRLTILGLEARPNSERILARNEFVRHAMSGVNAGSVICVYIWASTNQRAILCFKGFRRSERGAQRPIYPIAVPSPRSIGRCAPVLSLFPVWRKMKQFDKF